MYSLRRWGGSAVGLDVRDLLTRLWRDVFGELPPLADDSRLLSRILVENLPQAPPYQPVDFRMIHRRAAPPEPDAADQDESLRA